MSSYFEGQFFERLRSFVEWMLAAVEALLVGAVLLVVALVAAKVVERTVRAVLSRVGLDRQAERWGVTDTLAQVKLGWAPSLVLGRVAFVIVLFLVAQVIADALELTQISGLLRQLLQYAPRLVAAAAILLLGSVAIGYGRRFIVQAARDSGMQYASTLGSLFFAAATFVIVVMAVNQLQIQTAAVWFMLGWVLAGLALGLGIAFGFGARDIVRNVLAGFYARQVFPIGKEVVLGDARGILISITSTTALLDTDDEIVAIANSALLQEVVRQPK